MRRTSGKPGKIIEIPRKEIDQKFQKWAEVDAADPLAKSLILAEQAAWEFVKELTGVCEIISQVK